MIRDLARAGALCALALALAGCGGNDGADLLASGKSLLDKKDVKGAIIQFKSALQKDGKLAEARFLLGKALLESGDPTAALVELRKAQELQVPDEQVVPEMARAMLAVGDEPRLISQYADLQLRDPAAAADLKTSLATAYGVQRDNEKARSAVEQALRLKAGYAPAIIVMARLHASENNLDGAIGLLDDVLKANPGDERAGVLRADMLLQGRKDAEGALAGFRQVLQTNPKSVAARTSVANLLLQQGKTDGAKAEFEELKKVAPRHPETMFLEAQLAFGDKDYKKTREVADQILKAMPDSLRVLELAGAAEFRLKNYIQAEAMFARALKLAPKRALTRQMLAQTYLRTGQPEKTLEALQPMLDSGKPDPTTLALAGEAYLQTGDAKRSEETFQRAVKGAPDDPRLRTNAALAQMARGNNAQAAGELEQIAAGDSGPRADLALISARLRQGDIPGALKAVDTLEKKMPDQALPLHLRGRVLTLKKDNAGAVKSYEAALAKDPTYFPAVAALAALDLGGGKPEDARKRFDDYQKANPKSWQAKLASAELESRTGAPAANVVALLREAVKINPSEARPHLVLINQLLQIRDTKGALQAAQEATAALPTNLEMMDAQGRAELAAGDHQRAISTFKKLAGLQPRNMMVEMRLAEAYATAKDRDAAMRSLRHAVELAPDSPAPRRSLALMLAQDGKNAEALAIAAELQKRLPKDPAGWTVEGEIESARQGWDAAITAYRNALQRAATPENNLRLHAALLRGNKAAEAERQAAEWQKSHPKDAAFLYYLGDQALAQNDPARAEARYRAVLEIQPDNALALNNVAWLMVKQNKPGAVAVAEKAVKLLPGRAPLLDTLASALEADNQLPKAIETQKLAVAAAREDGMMALRLAKLYIKSGDKDRARAELDALTKLGDKFPGQAEVTGLLKTL